MTDDWNVPGSPEEIYQEIFVPAIIDEWIPRVLALANPRPGDWVLDVACGTGALTRSIAETVGKSGYVAGVDISPDMLKLARKISNVQFPTIEWRECDAQILPFQDETFDIAFCQLGLMFMPDRVAAMKEMQRVLRPSGRLVLMVWGAIDRCPGQTAMAKTWEKLFGPEQAAKFYRQHSMSDPAIVRSLLEAAGFQDISVQLKIGTVRIRSPEHLVRSYGALGRFPADEPLQAAAIRDVNLRLQAYVGSEGLGYPIEAVLGKGRKG
jgi:ubiquinone/menaquinone biosynthesis C-methylase UbiE